MPHLSEADLDAATHKRITRQLSGMLADKNAYVLSLLLHDLLTKTERLMLAKRLAAIVLLERGEQPYHIHQALKLSQSTILRLGNTLDRGGYQEITKALRQKSTLLDDIEKILQAGMPPRGKGRWRFLRK